MDIVQFINEKMAKDISESVDSLDTVFNKEDYLSKSVGIPRNRMPQLPKEHFDTFILHFARKYKIRKMEMPVSKLRPIQNEINMEKVVKMAKKGVKNGKRIFLVSKDNGIADGTHRHASFLYKGENPTVTVYKTNLPSKKLIEVLNKMKHSFNAELNENQEVAPNYLEVMYKDHCNELVGKEVYYKGEKFVVGVCIPNEITLQNKNNTIEIKGDEVMQVLLAIHLGMGCGNID